MLDEPQTMRPILTQPFCEDERFDSNDGFWGANNP